MLLKIRVLKIYLKRKERATRSKLQLYFVALFKTILPEDGRGWGSAWRGGGEGYSNKLIR